MVGYETKKKVISIDRKNIRGLDFNISPVSIEIDQIDVYAERDDDWDDQFKLFFDYFIGTSKNAAECKIVNKEIIDFKLSSDKKTLKAAAKDASVMHCLPAYRGLEITDDVMEGPQSIIWQQGENKMHGAAAILDFFLP